MVISLRKLIKPILGIILLLILVVTLWSIYINKSSQYMMGGYLHNANKSEQEYYQPVSYTYDTKQNTERFQRPSKQPALKLKYVYSHNESFASQNPLNQKTFSSPEDVVLAYYAILKESSNMDDYYAGCGTIGYAKEPYPHAYELLSKETKQKISLDKFIASFHGTGHTTLLKLIPVYKPPQAPKNMKYFLVEIEVITGVKRSDIGINPPPTYFAYYYGLVRVEFNAPEGWKIKAIDYHPEDFLCAPYHFWQWDAPMVIQVIGERNKLIEVVEKVDVEGSSITVYAKGNGEKYRFDAIRLTNGTDIFLHEYVLKNGDWVEMEFEKYLKFSILQYQNSENQSW